MNSKSHFSSSVLRSVVWVASSGYMMTAVSFIGNLLLARLLSPAEFGDFTLVASIIMLVFMFAGFGSQEAIVHYRGENAKEYVRTAFWISILIATVLTVLGVIVGVVSPWFLPESSRTISLLIVMMSLAYFVYISGITLIVLLQRDLNHRPIAIIEVISKVLSFALAVYAAINGAGVWALFIREAAEILIKFVCLIYVVPDIPRFGIDRQSVKQLRGFGSNILLVRLTESMYGRIDNLIVARSFGNSTLGSYGMAYRLSLLGFQLTYQAVGGVMFSAFSVVQNSKERLQASFRRSMFWLVRLALLVALLALTAGEATTVLLYGEKWREAGQLLVGLTPFVLLLPLYDNNRMFFEGIGQLKPIVQANIVKLFLLLVGLIVLPQFVGLQGVIIAVNMSLLCGWLVQVYGIHQQIEVAWIQILLRPCLAFIFAWGCTQFLPLSDIVGFGRILITIFTSVAAYLLSLFLFEYKLLFEEVHAIRAIALTRTG